ncbi:MAG: hypothetical protein AAF485_07740 [Chloroflexota bacterium]
MTLYNDDQFDDEDLVGVPDDDEYLDEEIQRRPGILGTLIILIMILTMLGTLIWPILSYRTRRPIAPTPTRSPFLEARASEHLNAQTLFTAPHNPFLF